MSETGSFASNAVRALQRRMSVATLSATSRHRLTYSITSSSQFLETQRHIEQALFLSSGL
jgi:hypothetical protein